MKNIWYSLSYLGSYSYIFFWIILKTFVNQSWIVFYKLLAAEIASMTEGNGLLFLITNFCFMDTCGSWIIWIISGKFIYIKFVRAD